MTDINNIKDDRKFKWTDHAKRKVMHYGLSPNKIKSIIRAPQRLEESIVEGVAAAMRVAGSRKNPYEVWTMFQVIEKRGKDIKMNGKKLPGKPQKQIKIISAWKYPGFTEPGDPVPIPENTIMELGIEAEKVVGFSDE